MRKILISLVSSEKSIDLEVPGEVSIRELIPNLCEILGLQSVDTPHGDSLLWGLGLLNADSPLDASRSLSDYGVVDGTTLLLQDMNSWERQVHRKLQHAYKLLTFSINTLSNKFHRTSRDYTQSLSSLPQDEVVIPSPPLLQPIQNLTSNWLLVFIPLVASLGTVAYAFVYHFNPFLTLVIVGIALLTSMIGIFARLQQQYAQKKREKASRNAYLEYLGRLRDELSKTDYLQRQVYARLFPPPSILLDVVKLRNQEQSQLWERRATDQDFLQVRIGMGAIPFCRPVRLDVNSTSFVQDRPESELLKEVEQLVASYTQLEDAPIQIDLKTLGTLTLVGNSHETHSLMRSILCQLVAFHSPDDMRIAAYFLPRQSRNGNGSNGFLTHGCYSRSRNNKLPNHSAFLRITLLNYKHYSLYKSLLSLNVASSGTCRILYLGERSHTLSLF